jgi:hypothetical protein
MEHTEYTEKYKRRNVRNLRKGKWDAVLVSLFRYFFFPSFLCVPWATSEVLTKLHGNRFRVRV